MQDTREIIEKEVENNPGISFSDLKLETGLSNGVLQYHIQASERLRKRKGAIMLDETCKCCELGDQCGEKCLRKILKKQLNREIVELVSRGRNQTEIAEELDLSRSTVCYHVNKLRDNKVLNGYEVEDRVREFLDSVEA